MKHKPLYIFFAVILAVFAFLFWFLQPRHATPDDESPAFMAMSEAASKGDPAAIDFMYRHYKNGYVFSLIEFWQLEGALAGIPDITRDYLHRVEKMSPAEKNKEIEAIGRSDVSATEKARLIESIQRLN